MFAINAICLVTFLNFYYYFIILILCNLLETIVFSLRYIPHFKGYPLAASWGLFILGPILLCCPFVVPADAKTKRKPQHTHTHTREEINKKIAGQMQTMTKRRQRQRLLRQRRRRRLRQRPPSVDGQTEKEDCRGAGGQEGHIYGTQKWQKQVNVAAASSRPFSKMRSAPYIFFCFWISFSFSFFFCYFFLRWSSCCLLILFALAPLEIHCTATATATARWPLTAEEKLCFGKMCHHLALQLELQQLREKRKAKRTEKD